MMAGLCSNCMTQEARSPHDLLCESCDTQRLRSNENCCWNYFRELCRKRECGCDCHAAEPSQGGEQP